MEYVIAQIDITEKFALQTAGHLKKDGLILLNEKEVEMCPQLSGDLAERSSQLKGMVVSRNEAMLLIKEGGWKNG
jgi:hypothetical protein